VDADGYPEVGYLGFVNCDNVTVQGLKLVNNWQGLMLAFTNDSKITGNKIANNQYGIDLVSSSNNTLSGNNVTANDAYGIRFDSYSNNNVLSGNDVTANNYGGIEVAFFSNNNVFHHNNFINNGRQVSIGTPAGANSWDDGYPSGGNYWDDYNGADSNHDGLGDTPYIIEANNTDNYPLMTQYAIPEFASFLILPLFFIVTLLAVIVYRRKGADVK